MVYLFHCLAHFTQHKALQFYPCCCKGYKLLLSLCCIEFHCVNLPQFLDPLICGWALRLLPVLGYCKLCCYEHWGTQVVLNLCFRILFVFNFYSVTILNVRSQHWNCQAKGSSIFSFLRKFHTVFHSGCTRCIPTNSALGFPFLRNLSNICLLVCLCWPL